MWDGSVHEMLGVPCMGRLHARLDQRQQGFAQGVCRCAEAHVCGVRAAAHAAHDVGAASSAPRSPARQAQPALGIQPPAGAQLDVGWSDFEYESADSADLDSPISSAAASSSSPDAAGPSGLHADAAGVRRNPGVWGI